jgi:hypothetical protein
LPSDGQTGKVTSQIILALNTEATAEALLYAALAGTDPAGVRQAMMGGFASSGKGLAGARIFVVKPLGRCSSRCWIVIPLGRAKSAKSRWSRSRPNFPPDVYDSNIRQ